MFSIDYIRIVDGMCLLVDILLKNEMDSHKKNLVLLRIIPIERCLFYYQNETSSPQKYKNNEINDYDSFCVFDCMFCFC
jgi:hypothetical protein